MLAYAFVRLHLINIFIYCSLSYDHAASDRGDPYCIQATSRLLNKDVVLNCLNMANTEMQEVINNIKIKLNVLA